MACLSPEADGLTDEYIDDQQNGPCTLTFRLPTDSEKWPYIAGRNRLYVGGKEFVLATEDGEEITRQNLKVTGAVIMQESWVLLGQKYVTVVNDGTVPAWSQVIIVSGGTGSAHFSAGTAGCALEKVTDGSGWTVGTVDVPGTQDLETEQLSVLANIKKIQEIWGGILVWDSENHIVHLRPETWQPHSGLQIRYAKNLKHIAKKTDHKIVTRAYPFGLDGLDISVITGGNIYIDNTSYTSEILEDIWTNQEIDDALELYNWAEKKLALMCKPRDNYKTTMVDLTTLPEWNHEASPQTSYMADVIDPEAMRWRRATTAEFEAAWNSHTGDPNYDPDFDFNRDGTIDFDDLMQWTQACQDQGGVIETSHPIKRVRIIKYKYKIFQPWICETELGDPLDKIENRIADSSSAAKYVSAAVRPNVGMQNLLKGIVDTFASTVLGASGDFDIIDGVACWKDGPNLVRVSPGGMAISQDGGLDWSTILTALGIVAKQYFAIQSDDGFAKFADKGLEVYDDLAAKRVHVGQYAIGKYGLLLLDPQGAQTILDDQGILQSWQDSRADNVDGTHPLNLYIYIPAEARAIKRALLRFRLLRFRAYETGAASGGSSSPTTSTQSQTIMTTDNLYTPGGYPPNLQRLVDGSYWMEWLGWHDHGDTNSRTLTINHGITDGTQLAKNGGGYVTFHEYSQSHDHTIDPDGYHGHDYYIDHWHEVTIPSHFHTVSVDPHTHPLTFGIYEGDEAYGVTVTINGVDRTSALGGGTGFNTHQDGLSLISYMTIGTWNTVSLGFNGSRLGRLDASIYVQAMMGV